MQDTRKSLFGLTATGFFIVLPVFLVSLVIGEMYESLKGVVHPLLDALPGTIFHDPTVRFIAVIVVLAMLMLLVGLLAKTRAGRVIGRRLDAGLLNRLPFYTLLRNLASGLAGGDGEKALRPVLVTVNPGLRQLGLMIERYADGGGTVFLPSSPNPGSGTVLIVEASLLRELRVPSLNIFKCLHGWGHGTAELLETAKAKHE